MTAVLKKRMVKNKSTLMTFFTYSQNEGLEERAMSDVENASQDYQTVRQQTLKGSEEL